MGFINTAPISHFFFMTGMALLPILIQQFSFIDRVTDQTRSRNLGNPENFDFIVVGAGTSGCVVANRLSKNYKVLLVEAGGTPFPLMKIPATAPLFASNPSYDWAYRTVPQNKSCRAHENRESLWFSGKLLGGSSNLNFLAYIRGHYLDFNNWATITGDKHWSYKEFLKYFKKHENYPFDQNQKKKYFGVGGEVNIESHSTPAIGPYFLEAASTLGYPILNDINEPFNEGFSNFHFTSKNGRRLSTFSAFLKNNQKRRKNLTILKYAMVVRVLLDESNLAFGIEYEKNGKIHTALAAKEIILSAGAVGSPKILMLSGIGPKSHLSSIGIDTKVDLKVGENLQDHIIAFVGPFLTNEKTTFLSDRDLNLPTLTNFFINGKGPVALAGIEATGLILSNHSRSSPDFLRSPIWPDIQLILAVLPFPQDGLDFVERFFHLRPEIAKEYYGPALGKDSFHIMSLLSRPKSRGKITLASSNYKMPPLIDPNYLDHPQDAEIILEGVSKILKMVETTKAFKKIGARLSPTPFPTCKSMKYRSSAYWRCYLESYTPTVYHPGGTCAMGKSTDPNAVVDSRLRVIGVPNLRVMDASIQPMIASTNPQAVCMAIGEIGAHFVLQKWDAEGWKSN